MRLPERVEVAVALPERADVVIVGAGLAGAALAARLRQHGISGLVLEAHDAPGEEASGRSAGMVRSDDDDPAVAAITARGALLHRESSPGFRRTGGFLIGRGDEDVARRVPILRGRGRFQPDDGLIDARRLLHALLEGADVRLGVRVDRLDHLDRLERSESGGGGLRVATSAGDVRARVVVNAAGAWAGVLGDLPLRPRRRHVARVTGPAVDPSWPFVWDVASGFYVRPDGAALLASACDTEESAPGDNHLSPGAGSRVLARAAELQPGLGSLAVEDAWAGQRTFAPDGRFVLGWDPRRHGLFWMAGLGGHGVTACLALAELATPLLLAGPDAPAPPEARAFAPSRLL